MIQYVESNVQIFHIRWRKSQACTKRRWPLRGGNPHGKPAYVHSSSNALRISHTIIISQFIGWSKIGQFDLLNIYLIAGCDHFHPVIRSYGWQQIKNLQEITGWLENVQHFNNDQPISCWAGIEHSIIASQFFYCIC